MTPVSSCAQEWSWHYELIEKPMKSLQTHLKALTAAALLAAVVLAPAVSLAKENGNNNDNNHESGKHENSKHENSKNDQENDKKEVSCARAFGHLIAPGWIKVNGEASMSAHCHLPYGIWKKWKHGNGTTTPDTIAPVVSDVRVEAKQNKAVITWTTNEKSLGAVFYGTSTPVVTASSTINSVGATSSNSNMSAESSFDKDHSITLRNLSASSTYYAVITSRDASGNVTVNSPVTFVTSASSTNDTLAPVINHIKTIAGVSSLNVSWKTNEPSTSRLYYGTTTVNTNATSTLRVSDVTLKTNHSIVLSGLLTHTLYHLVLQSVDASGNVGTSSDFTAVTSN